MKRIIIDFDGTILNSSERHIVVLRDCLQNHGINLDLHNYLEYKRNGKSTYRYLMDSGRIKENAARQIAQEWISKIENDKYMKLDFPYEDAENFLKTEGQKNQLYLVSASKESKNLFLQLHTFALTKYFKKIFCVSPVQAFQEKLKIVRLISGDLIVGDTEVEEKVGIAAQIPSFLLNRGFRSKAYWDRLSVESYESLREFDSFYKRIFNDD